MRMNLGPRIAVVLTGLCLSLGGCRREQTATVPDETPATTREDRKSTIAPVEHPAQMMPPDTVVYLVGESPRRAAEVLGRDRIAERFPDLYAKVSETSTGIVGRDVFDPANLPGMGIDPDGPVGMAMLSMHPEVLAIVVTLSDPASFRETMLAVAGRTGVTLTPTSLGSGTEILTEASGGEGAIVIRGDHAVLVTGRGDDIPRLAQTIATVDPHRSLANTRAYRRTVGATRPGDLVGFVDPGRILEQGARRRAEGDPTSKWAQEQLEEARARGESPEVLAELEASARAEAEWETRRRERDTAAAAVFERVFSSVEGIAFRVDAKPSGAVVELRMPMGEDAFLRRLLRSGKGAAPLSWALDGKPVLLLSGNLDVDAFVELVDLVARAEGETYDGVVAASKEALGVDLAGLRPLMTGTMGGAMTIDGAIDFATLGDGAPKWLGFGFHAELSDPEGAAKLLDEVASKLRPFGKPVRREAGRAELWFDVPDWRRVYVAISGRHLVVTTDRLLPERLARGKAGNVEKKTKPSAAYGAMSLPDASITFASEMTMLGWGMFVGRSPIFLSETSVEAPDTAGIPKSRTWQRKKKELQAAEARLRKAEQAVMDREAQTALDAIAPIGMTVVVAKLEEEGLWATGGQFVRAEGIAGAIVEVIAAMQKLDERADSPERRERDRLFEDVMRLQNELHAIRATDVERARSRKR